LPFGGDCLKKQDALIAVRSGLEIAIENFTPPERCTGRFVSSDTSFSFIYGLGGRMRCILPCCNQPVEIAADQTLLLCSPNLSPRMEYAAGDTIRRICIRIERQILKQYLKEVRQELPGAFRDVLLDDKEEPFVHTGCLTVPMKMAAHQIFNCPYEGAMLRMYLEGKALELIVYQLEEVFSAVSPVCACCRLAPEDRDRICRAREILIGDPEYPPSLAELAEEAGLNVTKLKRGFRRIFGTSVFGYLRMYRMEKARRILEKGEMNVTEAAMAVGYSNIGHFCTAFKKQFGIKPGCCLRNACRCNDHIRDSVK